VCIDERSKDFSKKDENCGDEVAIIKTDEEVAERQPNQTLICLTIRHLNRWSLTNKKRPEMVKSLRKRNICT
jgi:hypothetical protein